MNKNLLAFIESIERRFGTHKFRICLSMAILNFVVLALALDDDPKPVLPEPQINENNKEEK